MDHMTVYYAMFIDNICHANELPLASLNNKGCAFLSLACRLPTKRIFPSNSDTYCKLIVRQIFPFVLPLEGFTVVKLYLTAYSLYITIEFYSSMILN